MKSLHIYSLGGKPCVSPSSPTASELSFTSSVTGVKFLKCKRRNDAEEQVSYKQPMIKMERFRQVCFRAHSQKGNDELEFEPAKKPFHAKLDAIFRFARPQIFIMKACSVISVALLAVERYSDISTQFLPAIGQVIVADIFISLYIIGLNQLSDIEIDKVNKPYRPLVTGEYATKTIAIIISLSALMSFLVGWMVGSVPLLCSIFANFALGTIYSLNVPFLRWKRIPIATTFCIVCSQVVWPLGTYLHFQTFVLRRPALFSKSIILGLTFISIFAVSISLFKDIPDIEGDRLHGMQTPAVQLGVQKVFWICIGLVQFAYLVVILVGLMSPNSWSKSMLVASHMLLASVIWSHAKSVDLGDKPQIESFYGFMWKLISAEYLLMHFIR